MDLSQWKAEIVSILHSNINAGGFAAAISSHNGRPFKFHVGLDSIIKNHPIDETHLFGIGSITKVFVAVVVLQLIEEGKLRLTHTAGQFLSEEVLHDIDNAKTATIEQLLGHTAGIDSWEDDPKWIVDGRGRNIHLSRIWSKTDTLDYIRRPRTTAPERGFFSYSNTNYTLLGLIIEKVTQHTAEGEIRRRVLKPLGLDDTFFDGFEPCPTSRKVAGRYHYATKQFRETAGVSPSFPEVSPDIIEATGSNLSVSWAAGGMMSSATDLIEFASALRDGRLLKPESMKVMQDWSATTTSGSEMGHGLFRVSFPGKGTWLGHSGGVVGFSSGLWWKEDEDCIICVLSNLGTQHAGKVGKGVNGVIRDSHFLNIATKIPRSTLSRTIKSSRLTIRLADPNNEAECRTIMSFYDPVIRPDMQTPSDIRKKAESVAIDPALCTLALPPTGAYHLIYVNDDTEQTPIGFVGFSARPSWPCSDIGYKLLPISRGKGYAVEAAKAVVDFWTNQVGVKEIFALVGKDNVASQKVAEKAGFLADGKTYKRLAGANGYREEDETAYVLPNMVGKFKWEEWVLE